MVVLWLKRQSGGKQQRSDLEVNLCSHMQIPLLKRISGKLLYRLPEVTTEITIALKSQSP